MNNETQKVISSKVIKFNVIVCLNSFWEPNVSKKVNGTVSFIFEILSNSLLQINKLIIKELKKGK